MIEEQTNSQSVEIHSSDEVSLRDIFQKAAEFGRELRRNWKLIAIFVAFGIGGGLYKALTDPVKYPAQLTFMVNEDETGGRGGGLSSLLGSFGFSTAAGGRFNLPKILELAQSRAIMEQVLFSKTTVAGKTDLIANHLIEVQGLDKLWAKSDKMKNLASFRFKSDRNSTQFDRTENMVFKTLHDVLTGEKAIVSTGTTEESQIMNLTVSSGSEELSIALVDTLFDRLSDYYVNKSIEKQLFTYELLKAKTDSIQRELGGTEASEARFQDQNKGLLLAQSALPKVRASRNKLILSAMLGESIKNLEIAEFSLKQRTPFVQVIDRPIGPITAKKTSLKSSLLIGLLIGLGVAIVFIAFRSAYRSAFSEA